MRPVRLSARVSITSCACVAGSDKSGQACAAHTHARTHARTRARAHTHTNSRVNPSTEQNELRSAHAHTKPPDI